MISILSTLPLLVVWYVDGVRLDKNEDREISAEATQGIRKLERYVRGLSRGLAISEYESAESAKV